MKLLLSIFTGLLVTNFAYAIPHGTDYNCWDDLDLHIGWKTADSIFSLRQWESISSSDLTMESTMPRHRAHTPTLAFLWISNLPGHQYVKIFANNLVEVQSDAKVYFGLIELRLKTMKGRLVRKFETSVKCVQVH